MVEPTRKSMAQEASRCSGTLDTAIYAHGQTQSVCRSM